MLSSRNTEAAADTVCDVEALEWNKQGDPHLRLLEQCWVPLRRVRAMRLGVPGTAAFQGSREDEEGLGTARIRGDLTWHAEVCCPQMRGSEGPQRAGEFSVLCGPSEAVYTRARAGDHLVPGGPRILSQVMAVTSVPKD